MKKINILTRVEEKELMAKVISGDSKARDKMIKHNMPFVKSVVKKYLNQGVDYADLLNAATIGLINTVDAYKPTDKNKFITYAVWHIKGQIIEELAATSRIVRLPRSVAQTISVVNKSKYKLEMNLDHEATPEMIAEDLKIPVKTVNKVIGIKSYHTSLDKPMGYEDGSCMLDTVKGNFVTDQHCETTSLKNLIIRKAEHLDPHEQRVLLSHFGVGQHSMSIKDLSAELQMTENKIMKMKHNALQKMSTHSDLKKEFKNLKI